MHSSFQSFVGASFLAALLAGTQACKQPSVCGPTVVATTSGTIVLTASSPAYRAQLAAQNGAEAPHVACRAEATISATIAVVDDPTTSDQGLRDQLVPGHSSGGLRGSAQPAREQSPGYSAGTDPHLHAGSHTAMTQQGQYRVLGVGRGTDRDDCAKAAMYACNEAVEGYFQRTRATRTLGVVCQLNENQEFCAASTN